MIRLASFLGTSILLCSSVNSGFTDDRTILRATADLARDNIQRFPYGSMAFSYYSGTTASEGDARAGKFSESVSTEGNYRYDGTGNALYDLRYPQEVLTASWKETLTGARSRVLSFQSVTSGSMSVIETFFVRDQKTKQIGGAVSVSLESDNFYSRVQLPTNLGFLDKLPDYQTFLRWAADGQNGFHLASWNPRVSLNGHDCSYFNLQSPKFGNEELWIDMQRGATLVCRRFHLAGSFFVHFNDRMELIPGHGWLPLIRTLIIGGGQTQRVCINSYDFEKKLSKDDFTLTLMNSQSLVNPITFAEAPVSKSVNLNRLPASFNSNKTVPSNSPEVVNNLNGKVDAMAASQTQQPVAAPLPGELATPSTSLPSTLILIVFSLATLGGIIWFLKQRHRK